MIMQKIRKETYLFEFSDRLKIEKEMEKVGIKTFKELAIKMGVSTTYMCNVVNGEKAVAKPFLYKLKAFGINLDID